MGDFSVMGTRIRELRTLFNMNQKDFSKLVGCTAATLSAYENGSKSPSLEIIKSIAEKCSVSIDWLCGLTSKRASNDDLVTFADLFRLIVRISNYTMEGQRWDVLYVDSSDNSNIFSEQHPAYAIMRTTNADVLNFFKDWEKMYELYNAGTIDNHLYSLWINDKISCYEDMALELPFN